MEGEPVDLLFPTLPVPEGHRIAERTVVEGVTLRQVGLVTFLFFDSGQHSRQLRLHLIPRQVDASIVFQIPVHPRGDVHPGVTTHHDLLALLVQLEEVLLTLDFLDFKLR